MYLRTETFALRFYVVVGTVTSPHHGEGWWFPDAVLMSGRGGLWSMYVSRTERRGGGGKRDWWRWWWGSWGGRYGTTETLEQENHAPHFVSPLYQHLALCYFCALKASDESPATDKCLCLLVFYGPQMRDFIHHPHATTPRPPPLLHCLFFFFFFFFF